MDDKSRRNELLITLADINNLIRILESKMQYEKATDCVNQLLYAYDIKVKIIHDLR